MVSLALLLAAQTAEMLPQHLIPRTERLMTSLRKLSRSLDAPTASSLNILLSKKAWAGGNKLSSSNAVVLYEIRLIAVTVKAEMIG